jgi:hypothetical protein
MLMLISAVATSVELLRINKSLSMGGACVKGEDRGGTIDDIPATKKPTSV